MSPVPPRPPAPRSPLLVAAQAGQAWAWRELFETLSPAVAGYLRVQNVRDIDDLVSDVFLGVFRRIGAFDGSMEQFRSWVFVIAHHKVIDDRRRQARGPVDAWAAIGDEKSLVTAVDAETAALDHMAHEHVVELCGRLLADQRDVLLLRLVGDLTIEQIAEIVGKSIGAVKQLQRRGLAALQQILSAEGVPL